MGRAERGLARAADWAVAGQGARAHAEARGEGRRHVVKRAAAIAAMIDGSAFDAEPVAARGTFGIQTLHRPTRQILHFVCLARTQPRWRKGNGIATEAPRNETKKSETGGIVRRGV